MLIVLILLLLHLLNRVNGFNLIPENTEGFGGEKPPSARIQLASANLQHFFVLLSYELCFKQTVIHKISYSTYHCRFGLSYRFFHKRMAPYKIPNYVLGISLMPSGRNRNHYQKHIKVLEHFQ